MRQLFEEVVRNIAEILIHFFRELFNFKGRDNIDQNEV